MSKINKIRLDGTDYDIERGMLPEVVQELPQTGSEDTMYLVSSDNPGTITVEASGEYISLENKLPYEAPLTSVEMLGKAEQDGTPTPDSPQPISVVTGENMVKIEGKNLYNNDLPLDNKYLDSSGNWVASTYSYINQEFNIQPSTTYTWSASSKTGAPNLRFGEFDASGAFIRRTMITSTNQTITTTATTALVKLSADGTPQNKFNDPQLELGSTASQFEPYQGQEFEVNLGKNLLDPSATLQGVWNNASNTTTCTFFTPIYTGESFTISNKDTATWRFSAGLTTNPTNNPAGTGSQISAWQTGASYTITAQSDGYLWVQLRKNANTAITPSDIPSDVFMVERGSTAASYAPYFTPIELCKIGNYQDRIYKTDGKWYIEKQVGKVVLDGSETGWSNSGGGAPWRYECPTAKRNSAQVVVQSNYFVGVPYGDNWGNYPSLITSNSSSDANSAIKFKYTQVSTIDEWKAWLSTHPTTVYYWLLTPTTTEITNEALIAQLDALGASSLYLGVNNIGTETLNAMPTLKIEYDAIDPQKKYDEYVWVEDDQEFELIGQAGLIQKIQDTIINSLSPITLVVSYDTTAATWEMSDYGLTLEQSTSPAITTRIQTFVVPSPVFTNVETGITYNAEDVYNLLENDRKIVLSNVPIGEYLSRANGVSTFTVGPAVADGVELSKVGPYHYEESSSEEGDYSIDLVAYSATVSATLSLSSNGQFDLLPSAIRISKKEVHDTAYGDETTYALETQGIYHSINTGPIL